MSVGAEMNLLDVDFLGKHKYVSAFYIFSPRWNGTDSEKTP